jgi:hypothetical protein
MRRSRTHLVSLAILSGLICAIVLVLDASRVWLVAGPTAVTVLDTAALSEPARRLARRNARQWAKLGARNRGARSQLHSWRLRPRTGSVLYGTLVLVPILGTVALFLAGSAWWLALLGVLASIVVYAATRTVVSPERAYPALGRTLASSAVGRAFSRIPVLGTVLGIISALRPWRKPRIENDIAGQTMG